MFDVDQTKATLPWSNELIIINIRVFGVFEDVVFIREND